MHEPWTFSDIYRCLPLNEPIFNAGLESIYSASGNTLNPSLICGIIC